MLRLQDASAELNLISSDIIGAAIEVHRAVGPGLPEATYLECLCAELDLRRVRYEREVPVAVRYKGRALDCAYRLDMIVAEKVVVELKAVERLHPIYQAQMLTYLRLKRLQLGLLINFNWATLQEGIRRIINSR